MRRRRSEGVLSRSLLPPLGEQFPHQAQAREFRAHALTKLFLGKKNEAACRLDQRERRPFRKPGTLSQPGRDHDPATLSHPTR